MSVEYVSCPVCLGLVAAPHDPADEHPAYQIAAAIKRRATIGAAGKKFAAIRDAARKKHGSSPAFMDTVRPAERDYDQTHASAWDLYRAEVEDGARAERHAAGDLCEADTCDDCDAHRAAVKRLDARERYLDGLGDVGIERSKEARHGH